MLMTPSATVSVFAGDGELLRGEIDQHRAHLGAGQAQRRAAVLDRLTAGGLPLVGRQRGVGRKDLHPRRREIELLGGDLPERGQDALPELDLAGVDRGVAVAADPDPGLQRTIVVEAARQPRRLPWARSSAGSSEKASTRPPRPLVKPRRVRVGAFMVTPPHLFAGPHDGGDNPVVGTAAAEMTGQRLADIGVGRTRFLIQQFLGLHDHAVDAIAALRGLLVDEGLLQRMRLLDGAERLDGGDLGIAERADRGDAGARRLAVDQHRAGAALRQPTAELRPGEEQIVPQHVEQRRIGFGRRAVACTIDFETDGHDRGLSLWQELRGAYCALFLFRLRAIVPRGAAPVEVEKSAPGGLAHTALFQ